MSKISPHLLRIDASYSYRVSAVDEFVAQDQAQNLWGEGSPIYVIQPSKSKISWCHIVCATGPALSEGDAGSELVIIWWSNLTPDTERVLVAIDWEKHAKGFDGLDQ